jgi:hypothetical protein
LVFEKDDFIAWANENVVTMVGHNGSTAGHEDHKPTEVTDPKTKEKKSVCPSYVGITCEEHQACSTDAHSPQGDLPKVPSKEGFPNTYLISPTGDVQEIDGVEKTNPKGIIEKVTALTKKLDTKPIAYKKWQDYHQALVDGDKAVEDAKWKAALAAYAKVDADGKKLTKPIADKLKAKLDAVNAKITAKVDEIKGGSDDDATKAKNLKALRADVGQKFSTGTLPVVAVLDEALKATAPASPPK